MAAQESYKNKDGNLKKKYRDQPRYKVILGYEGAFKDRFENLSKKMTKEIVKEISTLAGVVKIK